jgi:glycosyltransferase involved in cell wall biosynthesis
MPFLLSACDLYAAPSRLEGFQMGQVAAGACGKPVLGIRAMAMGETLVDGETALLAAVAHETPFSNSRVVDYRASVADLTTHLRALLTRPELRAQMGEAGRRRVVERYGYRILAKHFVEIVRAKLPLE